MVNVVWALAKNKVVDPVFSALVTARMVRESILLFSEAACLFNPFMSNTSREHGRLLSHERIGSTSGTVVASWCSTSICETKELLWTPHGCLNMSRKAQLLAKGDSKVLKHCKT